tara:strand:+ start:800 stop:1081 length:282 start_codon:yes stop_codon:yes gene_type:complete
MKKILLIFVLSLLMEVYSNADIIDCNQFEKLKDKLDCKAKNLKTKLNEGQSLAKQKIEDFNETDTKKKFDASKLGKKLKKFKDSKTGSEFLKK